MELENTYEMIKPYLTNGEYVLWQGRPEKGHLLSRTDFFAIPFSLLWCGFAFFWEYSVLQTGFTPFIFFGIPFVLMGLYIVFGRFIHMAWLRKRTVYTITNLKVIRLRNRKVDIQMGKGMPSVEVEMYADGNGTIRIGHAVRYRGSAMQVSWGNKGEFVLENISDVLRVQQLLTQIASQ